MKKTNNNQTISYNDRVLYNNTYTSYGNCKIINKGLLIGLFVFVCVVTPFTNWLIPFGKKLITDDVKIRY